MQVKEEKKKLHLAKEQKKKERFRRSRNIRSRAKLYEATPTLTYSWGIFFFLQQDKGTATNESMQRFSRNNNKNKK